MALVPYVFSQFLTWLPLYLLWMLGIILAMIRWQRHPTVSIQAALAFVILIVNSMASTVAYAWLPGYLQKGQNYSAEQVGYVLTAVRVFFNLVSAVAWVLILVAIFAERNRRGSVKDMHGPRDAQD
jgi:hypothetical protein